jgi:polyhydroxyalkanoate synthase
MPRKAPDPLDYLAQLFQAGQNAANPFARLPEEGVGSPASAPAKPPPSGRKAPSRSPTPPEPKAAATRSPPEPSTPPPSTPAPSTTDPLAAFTATTRQLADMQREYFRQVASWWAAVPATMGWPALPGLAGIGGTNAAAASDKRFSGEAWQDDPRFAVFRDGYLAYSEFLRHTVEAAPVDAKAKDQMRFAVRQYLDAMSPANFLASNPEALQLAIETGGRSLVEGTGLFFKDLAKGRVTMTDEEAFAVGRNVAVTPGSVVYENDLIQLIQYAPTTPDVYARPLVIIPPCINKFYILDLTPDNSFVRNAVANGHTVFLASWRNITADLGHLTWDDYLQQGPLTAIDVAREISGAEQVNTLGFCVGGTLLASALGVLKANAEDKVASVTLLTTMLDFDNPGEIGTMITEDAVAAREATIGGGGVLEGKDLALAFSSLRANDLIWPYVVNSYLKGKAPPAFDLLYWNSDGTNLPGPMFCWYIRNMYLENRLKDPGKTLQCGVPIDLSEIDAPAYVYASREDHIVPWPSAYRSVELLGGPSTFVLGASGHIAGVINPPAKNKRNHWKGGRQVPDPEAWLATAESVPGSWWPHWSDWLAQYGGDTTAAPKRPGNRKYPVVEPAPGRYVMAKA